MTRLESGSPAAAFCADLGGTFIKFAAVDRAGLMTEARLAPTPARDWAALVAALAKLCGPASVGVPLGLSVAGIVDPDSGEAFSANVPCLNGRQLAAELSVALARPVRVANDADCMALAEAADGAGVGHRVVFGIVLGSGVGGGLVVGGRLVRGAGGVAGEWGHGALLGAIEAGGVTIPPQRCGCGNDGCLDTLGGARGLGRLHQLVHGVTADSRDICRAWAAGDREAGATIEAWLRIVAGPLAAMINVTGAGIVPVAGGLGNDARLVAALDSTVRRGILRRSAAPVVVPSRFGNHAGLRGAAVLVRGDV